MKLRALFASVLIGATLVPVGVAEATISSSSGQVSVIAPPATVNTPVSNTTAFAWNEQQGVTLASALNAQITTTGNYVALAALSPGIIPAGTVVDSQYFHSLHVSGSHTFDATLHFPTDIVGVFTSHAGILDSDVLGAPQTDYSVAGSNNGINFETSGNDTVSLPDLRTVVIHVTVAGNGDDLRVVTRHDSPPTINAGGPYTAVEGSAVTLHGTATDPDGDPLTTSWSFATTGSAGTVCTPTNTTTLSPSITCNDNAVVTATMSVHDAFNPTVVSSAQLTVSNAAPALGALTVPGSQVAMTSPVNVSANFTDAGTNDTHTATVDWGDTTSGAATVNDGAGSGSVAASHTYAQGGHYTVAVTLHDDDGGTSVRSAAVVVNGAPTADAHGPYAGTEGTSTGLTGTASDPEGDPLTTSWTFTPTGTDPGTTCSSTAAGSLTPTVTCNDDALVNAQLSVSDNVNPPALSNTTVTISNVAPVLSPLTAGSVAVGATAHVDGTFTDVGTNDTHTASVNWGDLATSNASITEANGSGSLDATHAYAQAGLYTVTVTLSDDNGGTSVRTVQILANSPPIVDAGGPYVGLEGSTMSLAGTATDADNDSLTYTWAYSFTGDPGTDCTVTGAGIHALTLNLVCTDDAVVTATLTADDGVNAPVTSAPTTVTVGNVAPTLGPVVQSATAPNGTTAAVSATFSDPSTNDTFTSTIDWGDGHTTAGTVSGSGGTGTVTGSHLYATDGSFTVTITLTDDNGGTATSSSVDSTAVISDTTAPVITPTVSPTPNGAGWNNSVATISWTVTDSLSPIDTMTGCDPTNFSSDTAGTVFTCSATSRGGYASQSVTVKLDQVAPLLSGAPTTAPNANGWYNAPVTIHWTCSDALSGIDGSCPANTTLSTEGSAVTSSASTADIAGNVTNATSAAVQIDTHAPVTTASAVPTWNNNDVVLTLGATDNLSGVDSTSYTVDGGTVQSGNSIVLSTEGIHTVQFWSTDAAGNVESPNTATVRIDKTAPTITSAQDPAANAAGWNDTDVTISFTCGDSLSGLASCSGPSTISTEGAGQTATGTAADEAGNTASVTAMVNIDKTPPTIHGSVPAANANGWYNSAVTATWACSDALSGIASCPDPTTLSTEGADQSTSGSALDTAGNTTTASVDGINIDETAPTITASVAPEPNTGGWNNGSVVVSFTCSDETSGIAPGACPADQTVSAEGISTVAATVSDRAGNSATASVVVRIDTIAPTITGGQTPAANGAGWNNSDVTVSFTCLDGGSGIAIAGCSPPTTLTEGAGQSVTGTALDTAGNTATTVVSGVNVDETPPTLSGAAITSPNGDGWYDSPVTVHWTCADELSGIAGSCPADSAINSEGQSETASAAVADAAGNVTTATSAPVNIDLTAPTTTVSSVPDWSHGTVALTLSANDSLSGVASTHYTIDGGPAQSGTAISLTTEGVHTVQYWSTDVAGNVEAAHAVVVKIDLTAPTITATPSPAANGAGWNKTDVTVTFECGDSLSGVASCSDPQSVTTEGSGQAVTGTAADNAGNTASATTTLNIDKTPPTIHGTVPPANANGWYSAPVTVNWTCGDALSGIASCPNPSTLSSDGTGQSASGTAADTAGNTTTDTVSGIKIDQTSPTITASLPATSTGWYAGPVTIHWSCDDNLSGVVSCPAPQTLSAEGVTTVAQTISDNAGNLASETVTVRIDQTPPTIVGSAAPAPNGNGWNNTDVTVSFACGDTLSGTASCPDPSTVGPGANQSVTGTAADLAGNTASATVSGIDVDKTPPTLSGAPTSAANSSGWYNHAVTIHWTCGDALSGVDAATCPANSVISSEGSAQQQSRTVFDLAGNATTAASAPVNVDLTTPLTAATTTATGSNQVTVTLSATDNLSGVAQTKYTLDGGSVQTGGSVVITGTGTHTLTYYSVDNAGNVEGTHVATIKVDSTAPTITGSKSPAANAAGWNKTNVTVTFTCSDASGIASCTPPHTVTTEGAGQHVAGTAIDNAGNSATATVVVSIDKTPPSIAGSLSRAANANGWFNATVTGSFTCGDALSGIASCTSPVTFGQGANQSTTGTATDIAGNSSTATIAGVNVDLTKPTITATASGTSSYGSYSDSVTIHFTCTDALSGIVPLTGCPADRVVTSDGTTTVSGTATDRAGNTATTSITVTVKRVCEREQDTFIDIDGYRLHASYSDAQRLKHVEDDLGDFDDPSHCRGGDHLDHDHGSHCFGSQHDAVDSLHGIYGMHGVPSSVIDDWADSLTDSSRIVAATALDDAKNGHGSSTWISRSQSELNAGDSSYAHNDDSGAVGHYENAWEDAQQAMD